MIKLGKCSGVRPVGTGKTRRRLLAKTVHILAVGEANKMCGTDHICYGLEAGIKRGTHVANEAWMADKDDEKWGFLLVDTRNAFHEGNCIAFYR